MRRLDKEINDSEILTEILDKSEICRIGLVQNNEAYIVPVNYAYYNNKIYFHTAQTGRKMEIMRSNSHVSFEIEYHHEIIKSDIPCGWTTKYRSVMGRGIVQIDNSPEMKKFGLDLIMKKYGAEMVLNYDSNILNRMTIIVLEINQITGKQSGTW